MKVLFGKNPISIDFPLLILRLALGIGMLTHGWPKFQRVLDGNFKFGDPIGLGPEVSLVLAVFAEFICSILIILGFYTRFATIPIIITMLVAYFIAHAGDDFSTREKSFLYLAGMIALFFTGPGKMSFDKKF